MMNSPKTHPLFRVVLIANACVLLLLGFWTVQLILDVQAAHRDARRHADWMVQAQTLALPFVQLSTVEAAQGRARLLSAGSSLAEVPRLYAQLERAVAARELELELDLARARQTLAQLDGLRRGLDVPLQQVQPLAAAVAADLHDLTLALRGGFLKVLARVSNDEQRLRNALLQLVALGGLNLVLLLLLDRRLGKTERSLAELEFRASHDAATGVWNRETVLKFFQHEAERAERGGLPLSVLKLEPRALAASPSPEAMDELLRETAVRISSTLRPFDALGRMAGNQFFVVLANCKPEHTGAVVERLRRKIQTEPVRCGGVAVQVAPIIGAAGQDEVYASSAYVLVRAADAALQRAMSPGSSGFELASADELDKAVDPKIAAAPGYVRRRG